MHFLNFFKQLNPKYKNFLMNIFKKIILIILISYLEKNKNLILLLKFKNK